MKCILCGKEWEWYESSKGDTMISISGAINVCADCQPVVREFNNRHKHLQREINELTNEWYKLINRRYHICEK